MPKGDPKRISPSDRAKEYHRENLIVSNHKLFCSACREELPSKKSSIEAHVKSKKHASSKQRLITNRQRDADIADSLRHYDSTVQCTP